MKVIKEGNSVMKEWWIGKRITCPNCGKIVELEPIDDENWNPTISSTGITYRCGCGSVYWIHRSDL